jgi:hypothetical protein
LAVILTLALTMGVVAATALAKHGADDGPEGTTGTTGGTTGTTTTGTTTNPGVTQLSDGRVRVTGTVVRRNPDAARFGVKPSGHRRVRIVDAPKIPQLGRSVVVRGRRLDDGSIDAGRVRVRHDGEDVRGCEPGDDCGGLRDGDDDSSGHGGGGHSGRH